MFNRSSYITRALYIFPATAYQCIDNTSFSAIYNQHFRITNEVKEKTLKLFTSDHGCVIQTFYNVNKSI
jgi:hypothetical protein